MNNPDQARQIWLKIYIGQDESDHPVIVECLYSGNADDIPLDIRRGASMYDWRFLVARMNNRNGVGKSITEPVTRGARAFQPITPRERKLLDKMRENQRLVEQQELKRQQRQDEDITRRAEVVSARKQYLKGLWESTLTCKIIRYFRRPIVVDLNSDSGFSLHHS